MAFTIAIKNILVVDRDCGDNAVAGTYKTINQAIEASPRLNKDEGQWNCIRIKPGVYSERVVIPSDKPWTYLEGAGQGETRVISEGDTQNTKLDETATLTTRVDNILVKGITFVNSYNAVGSKHDKKQAAAALIMGDRSAFFDCGFFGLQDTLWDHQGRHYFKDCTIEGAVDFIFGGGRSIYEKCKISVVAERLNGTVGYITAHVREDPKECTGYVFKYCTITGNGKTYLGRPWIGDYARVVFYKTSMSEIIVPQGWSANGHIESRLTFEEIECTGLGAAKDSSSSSSSSSGRVKWANKPLSKTELDKLLSLQSYINQEGWIPRHLN